jgi:hypothetical protein
MSEPHSRVGSISRQHAASSAHSVLAPAYERRLIRVAHGIQFHPDQVYEEWRINPHLDSIISRYPNVEKVSNAEYRNHRQRVIFDIQETTDKAVFRRWLETPEAHVIYNGHARYGRGPCFGRMEDNDMLTEDWGEGTNRSTTGSFRIGYPFIPVPVSEIEEHGYTAHLLKESEGVPEADDCHPDLLPYRRSLQPRTPDQLHPGLARYLRGHQSGDRYLAYRSAGSWKVVHHAGWQNTASAPNDWGGTNIQCRVFCHFGCSTFHHNYPIVRRIAQWTREGNERYAYWTSHLAYSVTASRWVANLVTYNVENAFASWKPSLDHAVARTNRDVRAEGYSYRVI